MKPLKEAVIKAIATQTGVAKDTIKDADTFGDLGCDSLDMVELVMMLEDDLEMEIDEFVLFDGDTVNGIPMTVATFTERLEQLVSKQAA